MLKKYRCDILGEGTSCSIRCLPLSLVEVGRCIGMHTRGLPIHECDWRVLRIELYYTESSVDYSDQLVTMKNENSRMAIVTIHQAFFPSCVIMTWMTRKEKEEKPKNITHLCCIWSLNFQQIEKQRLLLICYESMIFSGLKYVQIVGEMPAEQRKILLFFWTSVKHLPVEGFAGLASRLHIYKTVEPADRLPTSHTCFYRLCFPSYPSMAVMGDRLRIITQEHVGCSFGTWWDTLSALALQAFLTAHKFVFSLYRVIEYRLPFYDQDYVKKVV